MAAENAVTISLLTTSDEPEMLAFEQANREFFARTIGDRGDAYFAEFPARHARLVAENESGTSMLFAVRSHDGQVVGRVNIGLAEGGSGEIGYRIAEDAGGRGVAKAAVALALTAAAERGVTRVTAMTTEDNLASRRVLEANGFTRVEGREPTELEVGQARRKAVHFTRELSTSDPLPGADDRRDRAGGRDDDAVGGDESPRTADVAGAADIPSGCAEHPDAERALP